MEIYKPTGASAADCQNGLLDNAEGSRKLSDSISSCFTNTTTVRSLELGLHPQIHRIQGLYPHQIGATRNQIERKKEAGKDEVEVAGSDVTIQ